MNISLFRQSWAITLTQWRLWVLNLALFLAFLPAMLLTGGFGLAVSFALDPSFAALPIPGDRLRDLPAWVWAGAGAGALASMVLSIAVSWLLQAAAMRGAALAAEGEKFTLAEAFALGRERFAAILRLSLLFGLLVAALTLLPYVLLLMVPDRSFAAAASNFAATGLAPLNGLLSIAALLVLMSVALEDTRPEDAPTRAWQVFRSGWRPFLVVVGMSVLAAFLAALFVLPLAVVGAAAALSGGGWILVLVCAVVTLPLALFTLIFTAVYILVLFTLTYRMSSLQLS